MLTHSDIVDFAVNTPAIYRMGILPIIKKFQKKRNYRSILF